MIKKIRLAAVSLLVSALVGAGPIHAEDTMVYETYPGTNVRDYNKPGVKIEDDNVYQTYPGTNVRDYNKPGYKISSE